MSKSEAQKRATLKYDKQWAKQILLKLNKKTDADILQKLDEVGNKQGYIKGLIREDIKNETNINNEESKGEQNYGTEEN